jgi:hypothetical protein
MKTKKEAIDEFKRLLNDDFMFGKYWNDCDDDFYEWCSNYDDLNHIKKPESEEIK